MEKLTFRNVKLRDAAWCFIAHCPATEGSEVVCQVRLLPYECKHRHVYETGDNFARLKIANQYIRTPAIPPMKNQM